MTERDDPIPGSSEEPEPLQITIDPRLPNDRGFRTAVLLNEDSPRCTMVDFQILRAVLSYPQYRVVDPRR